MRRTRESVIPPSNPEVVATPVLNGLLDRSPIGKFPVEHLLHQSGQFAVRGGIVDVFSPEAPRPVRLELFGDTIESLREFDPSTQRSVAPVERTTLLPLTDYPRRPELLERLYARVTGGAYGGGFDTSTRSSPRSASSRIHRSSMQASAR